MGKKAFICIVCFLLFLCVGCGHSENAFFDSEENEFWTDADNTYSITAPEGFVIDDDDSDGFIFIYREEKSIPYIMIKQYRYEGSETSFESEYIKSLKDNYSNSGFVLENRMNNNIGGKKVVVLESSYKIDEYSIDDMRCILEGDECFYVFTKKEVPSLNHNLASELDFVLRNFKIL